MQDKTYIDGKDAALEDSIQTFLSTLKKLGFNIIEKRWLNPAPYIYSVHICDADCPQVFSNGKGASKNAALASAYGELLERLSTGYLWADFRLQQVYDEYGFVHHKSERWFGLHELKQQLPHQFLDTNLKQRYLNNQCSATTLIDLNAGALNQGICTLPYVRQSDYATCYIPVNLIANIFVSNGMSAGNNIHEALVQGLSEIFERAIKQQIITQAISLPKIPAELLSQFPNIEQGLNAINQQGFKVTALDASLGGQFPVIAVLLQHPNGGLYASFGAHPNFQVALERALTELLQGRALNELDNFPAPTANMEQVCDMHNLELHFIDSSGHLSWALLSEDADYEFYDWHNTPIFSLENKQAALQIFKQLKEQGYDSYVFTYNQLGIAACRILVPGFSDIYHADELLLNNNNQSLEVGNLIFDLANLNTKQQQILLDNLEENALNDQLRISEWAGFLIDKQSPWGRLRVGELKMRLNLALGQTDDALFELESLLTSQHLQAQEKSELSCLKALLELATLGYEGTDLKPYLAALSYYYSIENIKLASQQIAGKHIFSAYPALDKHSFSPNHQALLTAYKKVLNYTT